MQHILYNLGASNISATAWRSALNLVVNPRSFVREDQHLLNSSTRRYLRVEQKSALESFHSNPQGKG